MVEGARLERVYTGNRIEGSNPSPSAKLLLNYWHLLPPHRKFLWSSEGLQMRTSPLHLTAGPGGFRAESRGKVGPQEPF